MFQGVLGDEVDDGDGAFLVLPPGACDALFEAGGIERTEGDVLGIPSQMLS